MNKIKIIKNIAIIIGFLIIVFKILQQTIIIELISDWIVDSIVLFLILVILSLEIFAKNNKKTLYDYGTIKKESNKCPKCGAGIDKTDLFCPDCGKKLK